MRLAMTWIPYWCSNLMSILLIETWMITTTNTGCFSKWRQSSQAVKNNQWSDLCFGWSTNKQSWIEVTSGSISKTTKTTEMTWSQHSLTIKGSNDTAGTAAPRCSQSVCNGNERNTIDTTIRHWSQLWKSARNRLAKLEATSPDADQSEYLCGTTSLWRGFRIWMNGTLASANSWAISGLSSRRQ